MGHFGVLVGNVKLLLKQWQCWRAEKWSTNEQLGGLGRSLSWDGAKLGVNSELTTS